MFRESRFEIGRPALNFARGPAQGNSLVLLHGVVRCWQDFMPILPALAARWKVFALDHRGHGKSDRAEDGYRVVDYAADATRFVHDCVAEPAVIYGHSLGAMVALAVAAQLPQHVRAIVLEDPPCETLGRAIGRTSYPQLYAAWRDLLEKPRTVPQLATELAEVTIPSASGQLVRLGDVRDATSLRFTAKCLGQLDPAVLTPLIEARWFDGYDLDALLAQVRCPVLILQADTATGGMLTDEDAGRLQHGLADATLVRFPQTGHLLHWQATELTMRHVWGFLESV